MRILAHAGCASVAFGLLGRLAVWPAQRALAPIDPMWLRVALLLFFARAFPPRRLICKCVSMAYTYQLGGRESRNYFCFVDCGEIQYALQILTGVMKPNCVGRVVQTTVVP